LTINKVGKELDRSHDVRFIDEDFKKGDGFKHSVEMSKAENLYRQKYCGCLYSKMERDRRKGD
jgi:predicted adenine nucleotide alpha hydrolase (AANH) superfamily ATPase